MKRHTRASGAKSGETGTSTPVRERAPEWEDRVGRVSPRQRASRAHLRLATIKTQAHTLELTGELNHALAHELEAEIDRLCEEGVDGITLDLRGLTGIDGTGVAVVVFRCGLCKRRGFGFDLVPGPRAVQFEFERAGVAGLLPFQDATVSAEVGVAGGGESPAGHSANNA